jgi:hypothetical protein
MDSSVTIIVESYNFTEDRDATLLRRALRAACDLLLKDPANREVILTDAAPPGALSELLKDFPEVRRVAASGLSYDEAKFRAVREARGEYVLFLDGDCMPQPGWLDAHCAALRSGETMATGGFTRYEGGWFAALCTLLDFGFLLPLERRSLGCYASNNSGFHRSTLLEIPMCESEMRCNCYAHAQALMQARKPVLLIPEARVRHKTPHFFGERFRQGSDKVAACRVNPDLRENAWLRLSIFAAPLFYREAVRLDWQRLALGHRDLKLPRWSLPFAALLCPVFRLVDLCGIVKALAFQPPTTSA